MLRPARIAESLLLLMATSIAGCADAMTAERKPPDEADTSAVSPMVRGAVPAARTGGSPEDSRKSRAKRLTQYSEVPDSVGDYVVLSGRAESHLKAGAYLLLSDDTPPIYVRGIRSWPAAVEGRAIRIWGVLGYYEFRGPPLAATAGDHYFLKEARWELQPSANGDARQKFEAAVETIATDADPDTVNAAAAALRAGGLPAIEVLVSHLDDRRVPASDVLMRAVEGRIVVGTQCFWLIQGMLEEHQSKFERDFSPLTKANVAEWLAEQKGKTLAELRVDACEGAIEKIREYQQAHPNDDDYLRHMESFRERLAKLQRLSAAESPGPPRDPNEPFRVGSQPPLRTAEPRSEIDGWWYKVGDDRKTRIGIRGEQFSRRDAVAGPYLEGRVTVRKRDDGRYELHVIYPQVLAGVSGERLIIERQGKGIVVFGPDGEEEGEYRQARPKPEPEPVTRIHARDLGGRDGVRYHPSKVLIVGHLGRPLHEMMTVRGVWHYPVNLLGKDYPLLFRVTHVDGKALERPVTFHEDFVHGRYKADRGAAKPEPSEGDIWEMEAFESGHFEGVAPGWDEAVGTAVGRLFHGFVTELYGVVVRVESAGKPGK